MSSNTCTIVHMLTVRDEQVQAIEAQVAAAAGALNAAHGRLVELAADLIESDLWRGYGIKSVEHWLCWKAGLSPERARQIIAVARRRRELPATFGALVAGQLSVDQVITVAKHAPARNDAEVASFAKVATVTQLRSTLSRYTFTDPDTDQSSDAAATSARGGAAIFHGGQRFKMTVDAPADDGALIEQALKEAKDALFHTGQPNVGWMDALLEICNRSLSTVASTSRRSKYRVYLHVDTEGGWLNQGQALPQSLLHKICCDGLIQPVWETEGAPVNVGRTQRIVPDRTRRLILDRDRTCLVPGCGAAHHLEVHHLISWLAGGLTDTGNLGALCPFHHDALHRGELTITGNADDPTTLLFTDGFGRVMPSLVPPTPPVASPTGPDATPEVVYRNPPGERIQSRWVTFSRPQTGARTVSTQPNAPPL